MLNFAMGLEIASEKKEPTKPTTTENTASIGTLRPLPARNRSAPSNDSTTVSTTPTARLVSRNRTILFIAIPSSRYGNPYMWDCRTALKYLAHSVSDRDRGQNGMSSSKSSNFPPLLAAGFDAAGREAVPSSPPPPPPASAVRAPPPIPWREPSICIWLATISVEYLSAPSLSCHLRVCRRPST